MATICIWYSLFWNSECTQGRGLYRVLVSISDSLLSVEFIECVTEHRQNSIDSSVPEGRKVANSHWLAL